MTKPFAAQRSQLHAPMSSSANSLSESSSCVSSSPVISSVRSRSRGIRSLVLSVIFHLRGSCYFLSRYFFASSSRPLFPSLFLVILSLFLCLLSFLSCKYSLAFLTSSSCRSSWFLTILYVLCLRILYVLFLILRSMFSSSVSFFGVGMFDVESVSPSGLCLSVVFLCFFLCVFLIDLVMVL